MATFGFNRTALRATQSKLYSMFYALFLKIALSTAELISFGHEFLFTKIEEEDIGNTWFQQYSATCHTAEATLDVLRPVFEDRIISRRVDVVWAPLSFDLTPMDYYLWGADKDKPQTIDGLKDNICEAIGEIQLHTIDNVLKN